MEDTTPRNADAEELMRDVPHINIASLRSQTRT